MSRKIIELGDTVDSTALITFPRKVKLLSLRCLYDTTGTAGNRQLVASYRLPTSDNEYAFTFWIDGFSANTIHNVYGDITFGHFFGADPEDFVMSALPSVKIPASGSVLLFDRSNQDVLDTILDIVAIYDDGGIEAIDPSPPTLT